jgi:hypothetical protein
MNFSDFLNNLTALNFSHYPSATPATLFLDVSSFLVVEMGLHLLRGSTELVGDYLSGSGSGGSVTSYFTEDPLRGFDSVTYCLVRGSAVGLVVCLRVLAEIHSVDILCVDICRIVFCSSLA